MKAKLINEKLNESVSHQFSPDELYFVARSGDAMYESLSTLDTIYTDLGDARPEAMFKSSQGFKTGEITRSTDYRVYTIQDLIDMIQE